MPRRRLGHKALEIGKSVDPTQHHTRTRRPRTHQGDVALRHRPGTVEPPIGATPRNRSRQGDIDLISRIPMELESGQMMSIGRIWEPMNLRLPPQRRECDDAVVQRSAAAEQHVSGVRVGVWQMQLRVGVQVQAVPAHAPLPRLRVVYGRRAGGQRQRRPNGLDIGKMCAHSFTPLKRKTFCHLHDGIQRRSQQSTKTLGLEDLGTRRERRRHFSAEHDEMRDTIGLLRDAADRLAAGADPTALDSLTRAHAFLIERILPHEHAEETQLYPALARPLGSGEATATMSRTHAEIQRLSDRIPHI